MDEKQLTVQQKKELQFINSFDDAYAEDIKDFTKFLVLTKQGLTADTITEYLAYLNDPSQYPHIPTVVQSFSAQTYNKRVKAVKNRMRKLIENPSFPEMLSKRILIEEFLKTLPYKKINSIAVHEEDIPTNAELDMVVRHANPRLRLIMLALNDTGLRISELLKIKLSDITEKKTTVLVRVLGKANKERMVYLDKDLYTHIRKTFQREGQIYLFEKKTGRAYNRNGVTNMIRTLSQGTVGKSFSAHDIRHRFATDLVREFGISSASKYIGHADISITSKIYDHSAINAYDIGQFRKRRIRKEEKEGRLEF